MRSERICSLARALMAKPVCCPTPYFLTPFPLQTRPVPWFSDFAIDRLHLPIRMRQLGWNVH